MKQSFLLAILLTLAKAAFPQDLQEKAIAYNDQIITEQNAIAAAIGLFSQALNERTDIAVQQEHLKTSYADLRKQVVASAKRINEMAVFDNNTAYLEASKALFGFYVDAVNHEYKMILDYMTNAAPAEGDEEKLGSAIESMTSREQLLDNQFAAAQQAYADKYGITLEENVLQQSTGNN